MKSSVLVEPVLVGREKELRELQHSLDLALAGKGTTLFISGEAGSGKTRLVNEFLNITQKKDISILFGWCLSNATLPYFPFIEAFTSDFSKGKENRLISSQQLRIKSWLSDPYQIDISEKNKFVTPQIKKDQAFATVTRELLFMSSQKPLILILEDMHWADSASLALLHYISRAISNERILVLVTYRSEETSGNNQGHPHQLVETIHLMSREDLFKEIKLTNLNQDSVNRIAESMLGGNVDLKVVEKLSEESQGNPLFVIEFLRMLFENKNLIQEHDRWQLLTDKLGIPSKIKGIILRRINALKHEQRRILDVASVIGEKFDPDLIASVLSKDLLEILETLNEILKSTSLVTIKEDSHKFGHSKSRELLYNELSAFLKREYHNRISEELENARQKGKNVSSNELAHHYFQAGNKQKAIKYSLEAGQDALAKFSNIEAIKHFKYVLDLISNLKSYDIERNAALEGLGDAYYANCMFEEAIKTFEELAISDIGAIKLRALRKQMEVVWYKEMNPVRLMGIVKKAEKYAASDRLEMARVIWNRGRAFTWFGNFKNALKDHEEALRIFEEEYSLSDIAHVLLGVGISRIMCGKNLEKGISEILRSVALFHDLGDVRGEIITAINRNSGFQLCGLYQDLFSEYTRILKMGKDIGDFENMAEAENALGNILQGVNKIEEAKERMLKALEYSKRTDIKGLQSRIYAGLTITCAKLEDLKQSEHYFSELKKIPKEILAHPKNNFSASLAEGVLLAVKNQWEDANLHFKKLWEIIKTRFYSYGVVYELGWRSNFAWILTLQGRVEEAKIQLEENQKILENALERFSMVNLQANLLLRREVLVGEEFEIRLVITNASNKPILVIKIEDLIPPVLFKINALPSNCCIKERNLEFGKLEIKAFHAEVIKLNLKAVTAGVFNFCPKVVFIDNFGVTRNTKVKPISLNVEPKYLTSQEDVSMKTAVIPNFRSEAAQIAFDFLINAFVQDYFRKKLPKERSGWRTLMDVVKQANVSQYSIYRSKGRTGSAVSELEHSGLVEARIFLGERGRGGKITKLRVFYDKNNVKQYIDKQK